MAWRDLYKVHPAADVFPMMSDQELLDLGEDIKANGLNVPPTFWTDLDGRGWLIDGRNRLEAMERVGLIFDPKDGLWARVNDPVATIISLNIHRRHLTPQQQIDLIVAACMAGNKPGHDGPVSKGGRGKKDPLKAAVIADAKAGGVKTSDRSVKRAIAKARGTEPKPKPKPVLDAPSPADPAEPDYLRLLKAFHQASPGTRKRFLIETNANAFAAGIEGARKNYVAELMQLSSSLRRTEITLMIESLRAIAKGDGGRHEQRRHQN
jgi:hypothetical protein